MTVEVFFDYTCGYSNRARHWLDAVEDAEIDWRPFSLLEQNSGDDGTPVFEQAQYADNPSLIALAVHEQVRAQGGDLHAYRRRMFTAWHEEPGRLSTQDIVDLGRDAGLRDFDREAGFAAVAAHHAEAAKLGVFGTPTLVLGSGQVAFVKLDAVPTVARATALWQAVDQLAGSGQDLRQWQRVTPATATG
jgi:predicted DsbA family dithiol-disulfide isomerase